VSRSSLLPLSDPTVDAAQAAAIKARIELRGRWPMEREPLAIGPERAARLTEITEHVVWLERAMTEPGIDDGRQARAALVGALVKLGGEALLWADVLDGGDQHGR
jgi:hypothetical protein